MQISDLTNILGKLNAFKTALKTAHWNTTESMNKHEQLDTLYSLLHDFQDNLAEDGMTIFKLRKIQPSKQDVSFLTIDGLVDDIQEFVYQIKTIINEEVSPEFAGLNGLCDSLIHDVNIVIYRLRMK